MSEEAKTLQCPSCGAALEPPPGATSMKCGYCGSSVAIPAEFRAAPPANIGNAGPAQIDFGQLMSKAIRMGAVVRLARSGDRADAIRLYQENSGVSAEQAGKVIDAIRDGNPAELDPGTRAEALGEIAEFAEAAREVRQVSRQAYQPAPVPRRRGSSCSGIFAALIIFVAVVIAAMNSTGPAHDFVASLISRFITH